MQQGVVPFQYQVEKSSTGLTALAGLPVYLDLVKAAGLQELVAEHVRLRGAGSQGWTDAEVITSLLLLNVVGGEAVDDLKLLEADGGFCRALQAANRRRESKGAAGALRKRWRKGRQRSVPSPSAVFRYLSGFHSEAEEARREAGRAFIPAASEGLKGLARVNRDFLGFVQKCSPSAVATLDMDASLVESGKQQALFSYRKTRAYQPLSTYWFEQDLLVASEFRDGNVPAGFEQLRVFKEALACLPAGVERVRLRSDSAGYQQELLKYCAEGRNERFNVIEFAVSIDVTEAFRQAVQAVPEEQWLPLTRDAAVDGQREAAAGQEWAEVVFVPNWAAHSKSNPDYRFIAIREPIRQQPLLDVAADGLQGLLPFPAAFLPGSGWHKVTGLVTNLEAQGDEVIWWSRQRCGNSEQAHAVLKEDLAGGQLPSNKFGVNAAWWAITVLAFNLNSALKRLALDEKWHAKRLKAIRFHLINLPGRAIRHARALFIRLNAGHPSNALLLNARRRILELAQAPPSTA